MGGDSNMKKHSINRWIIHCFMIILVLSMLTSAAANLYDAYKTTMEENFFEEDRLLDALRGIPEGEKAAEESILRVRICA